MTALDLCAGPGGWDLGARALGIDPVGIELDEDTCQTRIAAGLPTIRGDVAALDPRELLLTPPDGLIASPPCPGFSNGGLKKGLADFDHIVRCVADLARRRDTRRQHGAACADARSMLVVEPLRYTLALTPRWIACEQVPAVLPAWTMIASHLRDAGYHTWVGTLSAEQHGVPQTRQRAILLAHRDRPVAPPPATHDTYPPSAAGAPDLFGGAIRPYVAQVDVCPAWAHDDQIGFPRRDDTGTSPDGYRERDRRPGSAPAFALTEKARSWTRTTAAGQTHRVTIDEAARLQTFPADHPWQGATSSQFLQVGNAVPPLLSEAILREVIR